MTDLFETATQCSYRYPSVKGLLTTEDLWSIPLERPMRQQHTATYVCLDDIARALSKELKEYEEGESFVRPHRNNDAKKCRNKLDVVKRVIEYKMSQVAAKEQAAMRAQEKARLLTLIDKKDGEALEALSKEELLNKLKNL